MLYEAPSQEEMDALCAELEAMAVRNQPTQEEMDALEIDLVRMSDYPSDDLDEEIGKRCRILKGLGRTSQFAEFSLARVLIRTRSAQVTLLKDVNRAILFAPRKK